MKARESGMPDEDRWISFFDPNLILEKLQLDKNNQCVVDFGCGYRTFALPAAQRIRGTVFAFDIEPDMIEVCKTKAEDLGVQNIVCTQRDFVTEGTGLPDASADFTMLFNILHAENPVGLLNEAFRILKPGGKAGVIHWNYDPTTPRGPSMEIRPRPEQCQEWIRTSGFELVLPLVDFPPYHYGILGRKGRVVTQ